MFDFIRKIVTSFSWDTYTPDTTEIVPSEFWDYGCEYCSLGWATGPGLHYACSCNTVVNETQRENMIWGWDDA